MEFQPRVVWVTAGKAEEAEYLAQVLVEEGLAACVNILPGVKSIYRWEGRVNADEEWLLVIKTQQGHLSSLEGRIRELHRYDCPEIIAFSPEEVERHYLAWWQKEVSR